MLFIDTKNQSEERRGFKETYLKGLWQGEALTSSLQEKEHEQCSVTTANTTQNFPEALQGQNTSQKERSEERGWGRSRPRQLLSTRSRRCGLSATDNRKRRPRPLTPSRWLGAPALPPARRANRAARRGLGAGPAAPGSPWELSPRADARCRRLGNRERLRGANRPRHRCRGNASVTARLPQVYVKLDPGFWVPDLVWPQNHLCNFGAVTSPPSVEEFPLEPLSPRLLLLPKPPRFCERSAGLSTSSQLALHALGKLHKAWIMKEGERRRGKCMFPQMDHEPTRQTPDGEKKNPHIIM
nr:uncharacterized protein LOC112424561 [Macaca nemestrina]